MSVGIASTLSIPFRLMAWSSAFKRVEVEYFNFGKPLRFAGWRPVFSTGQHVAALAPLRSQWVYAFPVVAPDDNPFPSGGNAFRTDLFGHELSYDGAGKVSINRTLYPKTMVELRAQPKPTDGPSGDVLQLPVTASVDGVSYVLHWCFVASPVRLTLPAIKKLEERVAYRALPVRLALWKQDTKYEDPDAGRSLVMHPVHGAVAGVLDITRLGAGLNRRFQVARGDLIRYTTEYKGHPDPKEVRDRNRKKLIAEALTAALQNDDQGGIQGALKRENGIFTLYKWNADYDKALREKVKAAEDLAADLCTWLDGELILQVLAPSLEAEKRKDLWLELMGPACEEIFDSVAGKALLAKHLKDPAHFVHIFVLPSAPAPEEVTKVVQKSFPNVLTLWAEYAKARLCMSGTAETVAKGHNNAAGAPVLAVESVKTGAQTVMSSKGAKGVQFEAKRIKVDEGRFKELWNKFVEMAGETGKKAVMAVEPALQSMNVGLEVINLLISFQAFKNAHGSLAKGKEALATLGSLITTVSAFGVVARVAEKPLKAASGVGAVIDVFVSLYEVEQFAMRSDYSAMGGAFVASIGSALMAAGCYCVVGGGAAGATLIGLPIALALELIGGILVAIGTAIVVFTTDSDVKTFASHSVFGVDHGVGGAAPKWAGGTFASWEGDFDKQVRAMMNLLAGFTIHRLKEPLKVRFLYGYTKPTSTMKLEFRLVCVGPTLETTVDLRLEKDKTSSTHTGSKDAKVGVYFFRSEGRDGVDVEVEPLDTTLQVVESTVRAQLMLDGSSTPIPGSGAKVEHPIKSGTKLFLPDKTESKNF